MNPFERYEIERRVRRETVNSFFPWAIFFYAVGLGLGIWIGLSI